VLSTQSRKGRSRRLTIPWKKNARLRLDEWNERLLALLKAEMPGGGIYKLGKEDRILFLKH